MRIKITCIEDSREAQVWLLRSIGQDRGVEMQLITAPPFFDKTIERSIKEFNPDLIVLDLSLLENADSGFNVLRRLKQSDLLMNIPVVVCSKYIGSGPDDRNRIRALAYGAKAALPKIPFPKAEDFLK